MEYREVIAAIGQMDDSELKGVVEAYKVRHRALGQLANATNLATLKVGDKVRLKGLSPKYLNGLVGKIETQSTRNGRAFRVVLDEGQYTGKFGRSVDVPAGALEAV